MGQHGEERVGFTLIGTADLAGFTYGAPPNLDVWWKAAPFFVHNVSLSRRAAPSLLGAGCHKYSRR
jgi:hypothetical protein